MPEFDPSDLNIVLAILGMKDEIYLGEDDTDPDSAGFFVISYGFVSVKIKQKWYIGEACQ